MQLSKCNDLSVTTSSSPRLEEALAACTANEEEAASPSDTATVTEIDHKRFLLNKYFVNDSTYGMRVSYEHGKKDVRRVFFDTAMVDPLDAHLDPATKITFRYSKDNEPYGDWTTKNIAYCAVSTNRDDKTSKWVCFDLDDHDPDKPADVASQLNTLRSYFEEKGIPFCTEVSSSGTGVHVWIFFATPISAEKARSFGELVKANLLLPPKTEVFPKNSYGDGAGVILPWYHGRSPGCNEFFNGDFDNRESYMPEDLTTLPEDVLNQIILELKELARPAEEAAAVKEPKQKAPKTLSEPASEDPPAPSRTESAPVAYSERSWRQKVGEVLTPQMLRDAGYFLANSAVDGWVDAYTPDWSDPNSIKPGENKPSGRIFLGSSPEIDRGLFKAFNDESRCYNIIGYRVARGLAKNESEAIRYWESLTGIQLKPCFNWRHYGDLDLEAEQQKYIFGDCLKPHEVGVLAAQTGIGKTYFIIQLGISVVTGKTLLQSFKPTMQGPVLALFGEDMESNIGDRIQKIANSKLTASDERVIKELFPFQPRNAQSLVSLTNSKKVVPTPAYDELKETILELKPVLVFIDTLSAWSCLNENDASQQAQFHSLMTALVEDVECCLIITHHLGKIGKDGLRPLDIGAVRGSSAITDKPDFVMQMARDKDKFDLVFTKQRYGRSKRALFTRNDDYFFEEISDDYYTAVLDFFNKGNVRVSARSLQNSDKGSSKELRRYLCDRLTVTHLDKDGKLLPALEQLVSEGKIRNDGGCYCSLTESDF